MASFSSAVTEAAVYSPLPVWTRPVEAVVDPADEVPPADVPPLDAPPPDGLADVPLATEVLDGEATAAVDAFDVAAAVDVVSVFELAAVAAVLVAVSAAAVVDAVDEMFMGGSGTWRAHFT